MTRIFAALAPLSYILIIVLVALSVGCAAKPRQSTTVYPEGEASVVWSDACQCEIAVTISEITITEIK